jgi:hypothetical protein
MFVAMLWVAILMVADRGGDPAESGSLWGWGFESGETMMLM